MTEKREYYRIPRDRPITLDDIKAVPEHELEIRGVMWGMWDRQNRTEEDRRRSREAARRAYVRLQQKAREREARKKGGA